MTALGIDLGTTFGYAFDAGNYGSMKLTKKPKEPVGYRYGRFAEWLTEQYDTGEFDTIYYEDVKRHAGAIAAHVYGGYLAILQMIAAEEGIRLVPIGVGTVKKTWTGKGNASKEEMIEEAKRRGYSPNDDNAADAIAILFTGMKMDKEN